MRLVFTTSIRRALAWSALLGVLLPGSGCGPARLERTLVAAHRIEDLPQPAEGQEFLKAHLRNGDVVVFRTWTVEATEPARVYGEGQRLDADRRVVQEGALTASVDSVAIFETNVAKQSHAIAPMTVITLVSIAVTAACIANPKSCFGSCPTFYVEGDAGPVLQAEGFSASFAPSLEATDTDALLAAHPRGEAFVLEMRNEALETHVVRRADLLAVARDGAHAPARLHDGRFRQVRAVYLPQDGRLTVGEAALDRAVDVARLRHVDGEEFFTRADSLDLAARETLELRFEPRADDPAVLAVQITSRQSLLPTFLFYQALAYLGSSYGHFLARLDGSGKDAMAAAGSITTRLGGIAVQARGADGRWQTVDTVYESGPLAHDVQTVVLPPGLGARPQVRLDLTQGMWRIDRVALVELGSEVSPVVLPPVEVRRRGRPDPAALAQLLRDDQALTTLPGQVYELVYRLPQPEAPTSLFLRSRGYYLEWMRREWLEEESPALAAGMLLQPAAMLRRLAPAYKAVEEEMEHIFWNSRFATGASPELRP